MPTILVTGGAGYIGSQTVLSLLEKGYKVVVFDSLEYGHREVVPKEAEFFQGNLASLDDLNQVFKKYEINAVIHFAAYLSVSESVENPAKYYQNNTVGSLNLLQTMRAHKVTKIVFSSTAATYGLPENSPISEKEEQKPINAYGMSKLMVEKMLQDFAKAYQFQAMGLRYFNACGADPSLRTGEMHEPETHLIPIILDVASGKRAQIMVFGQDYETPDGTCVRDYIHTLDLASAHILALEKLLATKEGFCDFANLGTSKGYSVLEIIQTVEKVTGKVITRQNAPRRAGDPGILIADNAKAKQILNWNPVHSDLENIIQTAWAWHQKQHESYKN